MKDQIQQTIYQTFFHLCNLDKIKVPPDDHVKNIQQCQEIYQRLVFIGIGRLSFHPRQSTELIRITV